MTNRRQCSADFKAKLGIEAYSVSPRISVDLDTGERYIDRNVWDRNSPQKKNPYLFGDDKSHGILPKNSLPRNKIPVGNCAEVDAINQALNAGAKIDNLYIGTYNASSNASGDDKRACKNCTHAFKYKVVGNHTGWEE